MAGHQFKWQATILAYSILVFWCTSQKFCYGGQEAPTGLWPGLDGHYGTGKYVYKEPIRIPAETRGGINENWHYGIQRDMKYDKLEDRQKNLKCTLKDMSEMYAGFYTFTNKSLLCDIYGNRLVEGSLNQRNSLAHCVSWMMVNASYDVIESRAIELHPKSNMHRIIYEQRNTKLTKVKENFIHYADRPEQSDPSRINDNVKNLDMRILFMGQVDAKAFDPLAFDKILKQTNRPIFLEFDVTEPKTAFEILPQNVFEKIIMPRKQHDNYNKIPSEEKYMPAYVPRRTGDWYGPTIGSPVWNMFTVNCDHPDNQWLKKYALQFREEKEREGRLRYRRYLHFKCQDDVDVNSYDKWCKTKEECPSLEYSRRWDKKNPNKTPDPTRPTAAPIVEEDSGSNWWVYVLVALVIIIVLVSVAVYFLVFNQPPTTQMGSTAGISQQGSRAASNMSRPSGVSSVGPQATARSNITSSQAVGGRPSGTSKMNRQSSIKARSSRASRSRAGSATGGSRVSSKPSASRSGASRSRARSSSKL